MINSQLIEFYSKLEQARQLLDDLICLGGHLRVPDDELINSFGDAENAIAVHLASFEISAKASENNYHTIAR